MSAGYLEVSDVPKQDWGAFVLGLQLLCVRAPLRARTMSVTAMNPSVLWLTLDSSAREVLHIANPATGSPIVRLRGDKRSI